MKNRLYSLLIPWFMDGSLSLVQTAMPLLAVRLGASAMMLGTISMVAQAFRLPVCLTSARASEKVGRKAMILPSAALMTLAYMLFANARSAGQMIPIYAVALVALGGFYPSLQALIGDVSARGQLTKNLGAFNIGWCVGGGIAALAAKLVIQQLGLRESFFIAAGLSLTAGLLVLSWRSGRAGEVSEEDAAVFAAQFNPTLLLIARMGLFTAFFGYTVVRMLFPKLAVEQLGWSEAEVAFSVAFLPIGQGSGMLLTTISPWWRGKLWPQAAAQIVILASGLTVTRASNASTLAVAFLLLGCSQSVTYTAALYHGLSARKERGKNTGTHEAIVAGGGITGSLVGGVVAQSLSPRAPYLALSCLALACLAATFALRRKARLNGSGAVQ